MPNRASWHAIMSPVGPAPIMSTGVFGFSGLIIRL
jgi:hypothetical protein